MTCGVLLADSRAHTLDGLGLLGNDLDHISVVIFAGMTMDNRTESSKKFALPVLSIKRQETTT
jgi:hypothetical protein